MHVYGVSPHLRTCLTSREVPTCRSSLLMTAGLYITGGGGGEGEEGGGEGGGGGGGEGVGGGGASG